MRRMGWVGMFAAMMMAASVSQAQELLTNGGFESGNLSGYLQPADACGVPTVTPGVGFAGAYAVLFPGVVCTQGLQQTFGTLPGQQYKFSFWIEALPVSGSPPGQSNLFQAAISGAGVDLFNQSINHSSYARYESIFTATDYTTTLVLHGTNVYTSTYVDNLSVMAYNGATTTPEPSSLALIGTGIIGVIPMLRRRRS